jgi:hypothetical protein
MKLLAPEKFPGYLDGIQTLVAEQEETILGYGKAVALGLDGLETAALIQEDGTCSRRARRGSAFAFWSPSLFTPA